MKLTWFWNSGMVVQALSVQALVPFWAVGRIPVIFIFKVLKGKKILKKYQRIFNAD